jgi:hypothetical protein
MRCGNPSRQLEEFSFSKECVDQVGKQILFYFSNSNLNKDRFLRQKIQQSEDGFIPLKAISEFSRIAAFQLTLPELSFICQSLPGIKISSDRTQIGRLEPLAEIRNVDEYTVYVVG